MTTDRHDNNNGDGESGDDKEQANIRHLDLVFATLVALLGEGVDEFVQGEVAALVGVGLKEKFLVLLFHFLTVMTVIQSVTSNNNNNFYYIAIMDVYIFLTKSETFITELQLN